MPTVETREAAIEAVKEYRNSLNTNFFAKLGRFVLCCPTIAGCCVLNLLCGGRGGPCEAMDECCGDRVRRWVFDENEDLDAVKQDLEKALDELNEADEASWKDIYNQLKQAYPANFESISAPGYGTSGP